MKKTLAVLALTSAAAAAIVAAAAVIAEPGPLRATFESPQALGAAVLDAYQRQDREALRRLALSEEEFRAVVWPVLPASRPERNLTVEYVWGDLAGKSLAYLSSNLKRPFPSGAQVASVSFDGESTRYGTVTVHRRSQVTLTDASGQVSTVRLFGSIIEQDGRYKVFSYVTD